MPSWSHSKLSQYEKCPYALVLKQQHPQQPNAAMQRGTEIHKSIENYLNDTGGFPGLKHFREALIDLRYQNAHAEAQWGLNDDWTPQADFKSAWGKCVIDAFVHNPDKSYLLIVDFKTGKPSPISHQDQAQIYAIAGHCYYPDCGEIHTQFWYLDKGSTTQCTFTKIHTEKYKKVLQTRIDKMLNDTELKPNANKFVCKYCNYNTYCEYRANG